MPVLLLIIFFALLAVTLLGAVFGYRFFEARRRQRVSATLGGGTEDAQLPEATVLVDNASAGETVRAVLVKLNLAASLALRLQQAGLKWSAEKFAVLSAAFGLVGLLLGYKLRLLADPMLSMAGLAVACALLPYGYVLRKRRVRFAEFEEQFPEALDFMARALRAGHAFPTTLEMLGNESTEPVRGEFLRVHNEHHLGESVAVVLRHLAERMPLVDVRFFVSAVLMQRETGGNLGEILTKLSYVIRERFKLKGQVKAISAHGRLTATILTVLPVFVALAMMALRPQYLMKLFTEPEGKYLVAAAIIGQVTGYLIISKIVKIRV